MKRHIAHQHELGFAQEPFRLVAETATDHERVAREEARRLADKAESEKRQLGLDSVAENRIL